MNSNSFFFHINSNNREKKDSHRENEYRIEIVGSRVRFDISGMNNQRRKKKQFTRQDFQ